MNDIQALYSEIRIFRNENRQLDYKILRWHIIITADFDYGSQGVDVWDGGFGDWDDWID
jgi:hypothetical protein